MFGIDKPCLICIMDLPPAVFAAASVQAIPPVQRPPTRAFTQKAARPAGRPRRPVESTREAVPTCPPDGSEPFTREDFGSVSYVETNQPAPAAACPSPLIRRERLGAHVASACGPRLTHCALARRRDRPRAGRPGRACAPREDRDGEDRREERQAGRGAAQRA